MPPFAYHLEENLHLPLRNYSKIHLKLYFELVGAVSHRIVDFSLFSFQLTFPIIQKTEFCFATKNRLRWCIFLSFCISICPSSSSFSVVLRTIWFWYRLTQAEIQKYFHICPRKCDRKESFEAKYFLNLGLYQMHLGIAQAHLDKRQTLILRRRRGTTINGIAILLQLQLQYVLQRQREEIHLFFVKVIIIISELELFVTFQGRQIFLLITSEFRALK